MFRALLKTRPFLPWREAADFRAVPSWSVPRSGGSVPRNMGPFLVEKKRRLRQRTHKFRASRNMGAIFLRKKKTPAATYPQVKGFQKFGPLGIQAEKQGFRTVRKITGQKCQWKNLKSGLSLLTFRDLSSHVCQIFMRMARWWDLHFRKIGFLIRIWEFNLVQKYGIWFEMGPYGSVGAHIKTGESSAQDHF